MMNLPRPRVLLVGVIASVVMSLGLAVPSVAVRTPAAAPEPSQVAAGNPRLQALLDELVANGASGVLARVDDGRHSWRLASGAARLDPRQALRPGARFRV